jgi:hypothetical protein
MLRLLKSSALKEKGEFLMNKWLLMVVGVQLSSTAAAEPEGIRVFDSRAVELEVTVWVETTIGCPIIAATIDSNCLANKAYTVAANAGALALVPEVNQTLPSYADLFRRWNDLDATITVNRFARKAAGTGFYLPQGGVRSKPLTSTQWVEIRREVDVLRQQIRTLSTMADTTEIEQLKENIVDLEEELVGVDRSTASLLGTLATLEAVVQNFPTLLAEERESQANEIDERFSTVLSRLSAVESALDTKADRADLARKADRTELATKVDRAELVTLSNRVAALEEAGQMSASPLVPQVEPTTVVTVFRPSTFFYAVLLGSILLVLGCIWFVWSASKKAVKTATESTERQQTDVQKLNDELYREDKGVLSRVSHLETEAAEVRMQYEYLLRVSTDGLKIVGTPDQSAIDQLQIGEHIDIPIEDTLSTDDLKVVRVVRGTLTEKDGSVEELLYLYGVRDVNNGVSPLATKLNRTLLLGLKDFRVEGINPRSNAGLIPTAYERQVGKTATRKTATQAA